MAGTKANQQWTKRLEAMADQVGEKAMQELNASLEEIRAAGPSYQQWLELTERDIPEQTKIVETCRHSKGTLKEQLEQVCSLNLRIFSQL